MDRPRARRTPRTNVTPAGTSVIFVRVPAELADAAAAKAASKRQSTADWVRTLIAKAVKR